MPKSLSNRQSLEKALLKLATEYVAKPSGLLLEFELFLEHQGISTKKLDKERSKRNFYPSFLDTPRWKIRGFRNEKEMKDFENRPDFPGWDAL